MLQKSKIILIKQVLNFKQLLQNNKLFKLADKLFDCLVNFCKSNILRPLFLFGSMLLLLNLLKLFCKKDLAWHQMLNHICHRRNFKPVGTWNKGDIYTLILFRAQLFFCFRLSKKRKERVKETNNFLFLLDCWLHQSFWSCCFVLELYVVVLNNRYHNKITTLAID